MTISLERQAWGVPFSEALDSWNLQNDPGTRISYDNLFNVRT